MMTELKAGYFRPKGDARSGPSGPLLPEKILNIFNIVWWISASFQYNCAKNGKGLKIGTKEADTT